MARLPALVTALSTTDGRDHATLSVIARTIREAGLIATTKRGTGASEMAVDDAVNLIIGANAVQSPRLAALAVEQYRTFKQSPHGRSHIGPIFGRLAAADTLPDALTVLLEEAGNLSRIFLSLLPAGTRSNARREMLLRTAPASLFVTFEPASVAIQVNFQDGAEYEWIFQVDTDLLMQGYYTCVGQTCDRIVSTRIGLPTLLVIRDVLFGEDREKAPGKAHKRRKSDQSLK